MTTMTGFRPLRMPAATACSATRPLRILHVLDHSLPLHSGYTFRTLSILEGQRDLGWETFHLTGTRQGSGGVGRECCGEWLFHRTPPARGLGARLPLLQYAAMMGALRDRLADVARAVRPDILHVHSPVLNALPALGVGRTLGIPVVYEVRAFWEDAAVDHGTAREWGPRYRLTRALETHALRRADAVTTICEGLRRDILERGLAPGRVTVVPNAVDVSRFAFDAPADPGLMAACGLARGHTLGFAGSFYAYEGLDLLLEAMPALLRVHPQTRLLLVGGGPEEARLKALTARLGIEAAVHFTGRVPHDQVARYGSVMDVMVYPRRSRRLTELVTPLKPLEAMAMGRPVVASDIGGHRELIRDGHNGRLFSAGSSDALARCLLELTGDGEACRRLVARGREYVERERTWKASVARYRDVYQNLPVRGPQGGIHGYEGGRHHGQ